MRKANPLAGLKIDPKKAKQVDPKVFSKPLIQPPSAPGVPPVRKPDAQTR